MFKQGDVIKKADAFQSEKSMLTCFVLGEDQESYKLLNSDFHVIWLRKATVDNLYVWETSFGPIWVENTEQKEERSSGGIVKEFEEKEEMDEPTMTPCLECGNKFCGFPPGVIGSCPGFMKKAEKKNVLSPCNGCREYDCRDCNPQGFQRGDILVAKDNPADRIVVFVKNEFTYQGLDLNLEYSSFDRKMVERDYELHHRLAEGII
jgi:hypothetical protein